MEYASSPAADNNQYPQVNHEASIVFFGIFFAAIVFFLLLILIRQRCGLPPPVAANDSPSTVSRPSAAPVDRGGAPIQIVIQRESLPLCTFRQLKVAAAVSCCNICLSNYKDGEAVRVLPECCHVFHRSCIDPWLRTHATCPTCRHSTPPPPPAATL